CHMVFNYAPAIDGTLIGLRLMQADIITNVSYSDLFQRDEHYLLGAGEVAPTPAEISARGRVRDAVGRRPPHFRSYIRTDAVREIRFSFPQDKVVIRGEPVYRLWNTRPAEDERIEQFDRAEFARRVDAAEQTLLARLAGETLELGCATLSPRDVHSAAARARRASLRDEGPPA